MRPLYFLFKFIVYYILHLFFKRTKTVNAPKKFNAQTIFVVNHASAFLDPWVVAQLQNPIVFFMVRSDIFKPWLRPITWSVHMLPIYRIAEDGQESAEKNKIIFKALFRILKKKKSIIIFGEGYTDDVFIRSLKPIKKGPARIAFGTMVENNWDIDLKIQSVGINYADPSKFRSEVLVSNSILIDPKKYKKIYEESPSKAITELTREIEQKLREQITYLNDKHLTDFHNHIQSITKKGIAHNQSDTSIDLETRWKYSKSLANFINENFDKENENWLTLKNNLNNYFKELKKANVNDNWIKEYNEKGKISTLKHIFLTIILLPFFLIGFIHNFIPYYFVKKFAEKTFKRKVFWSGIKMMMGFLMIALFNIPSIFLFYNNVYPLYSLAIFYYLFIPPLIGIIAYHYYFMVKDLMIKLKLKKNLITEFSKKREALSESIDSLIKL